jgi:hypothetical protein
VRRQAGTEAEVIGPEDYFDKGWGGVVLEMDGGQRAKVPLRSRSFWRKCSELRSAVIGRWLIEQGVLLGREGTLRALP